MKIVVTGGAGFIGSAVCRYLVRETDAQVVNVDKLTYAANLRSLEPSPTARATPSSAPTSATAPPWTRCFAEHAPDAVMHLAAESHVDRSINGSDAFIHTNVLGTHTLLEAARAYWMRPAAERARGVPLPARLDRRGLRLARARRRLHRDDGLRSLLALFGLQGRRRSSGQRLVPHLRLAGRHLQLLQQLRALSLPREADPADDPQRARGASRCRSTATAPTCATGSTSRITRARCI